MVLFQLSEYAMKPLSHTKLFSHRINIKLKLKKKKTNKNELIVYTLVNLFKINIPKVLKI
jgi:hypothetical protein